LFFQWPRRPLVKRLGDSPRHVLRSFICRRSLFTPACRSSDRAATAFAVQCILQWLCHAASNPYATANGAMAHPDRAPFAVRVDSISTRIGACADASKRDVPGR
jgi:hypothetical protein